MNVFIEDLKFSDIEECYELNNLIFNEKWNLNEIKDLYKRLHKMKDSYRFLAVKDQTNKIIGYVSCIIAYNLFDGGRPYMELWWLGVHPEYRRKGIATKLISYVENIAKEYNCEFICFTSENNRVDAHEFYKKNGYEIDSLGFIKEFD